MKTFVRLDAQGRAHVTYLVAPSEMRQLLELYADAAARGESYEPPEVPAFRGLAHLLGALPKEQL